LQNNTAFAPANSSSTDFILAVWLKLWAIFEQALFTFYISQPMTFPQNKQAGTCLHITSLPGRYGIGELGADAREFIDKLVGMDLSVWQFLPTGPTAYGDSPYQSLSAFAGNELLIDTDNIIELDLLQQAEADVLCTLAANFVDYGKLIPQKLALLNLAAERFELQATSGLKAEFDEFRGSSQHWLDDYVLYRSLKIHHGEKPWTEWDPALAARDPRALQRFRDKRQTQLSRFRILQFLFARQWSALHDYAKSRNIVLFGDMPIYIALDSADAWAHPELLQTDANGLPANVAGVPPDYFSADGQLWGNPLYDWDYHSEHDFSWWVERLRHASKLCDLVRIDHFRGFESYWAVPANATNARLGSWCAGPGDALFAALRAELGEVPIVAEDLGIITEEVNHLRDRQGIPGMRVLQFDIVDPDFDIERIRENCVCYTGTHDNDTTAGWYEGSNDDPRPASEKRAEQALILDRTGGRPATIHDDLLRLALSSNAHLAIAPVQDFLGLGSEARLNKPGTTSNNWRWRLLPEQLDPAVCQKVRKMVGAADRQRS
jgi:4-alpha-glucanotransferase